MNSKFDCNPIVGDHRDARNSENLKVVVNCNRSHSVLTHKKKDTRHLIKTCLRVKYNFLHSYLKKSIYNFNLATLPSNVPVVQVLIHLNFGSFRVYRRTNVVNEKKQKKKIIELQNMTKRQNLANVKNTMCSDRRGKTPNFLVENFAPSEPAHPATLPTAAIGTFAFKRQ